jgi:hypothetical protein
MESHLVFGFMLYVNGQQRPEVYGTLGEAKAAAKPFLESRPKLRIVSTREPAPQPMRSWNYDYEIQTEDKWIQRL